MTKEVQFPDGTFVRASSLPDRREDDEWSSGLYADERWAPSWPAEFIQWEDFGVPARFEEAVAKICGAFDRAHRGEHVEVGCAGGTGRTGTILACMAVLAGVPKAKAVDWVRTHYSPSNLITRAGRFRSAGSSGSRRMCTADPHEI
ncbi:MAG: hypothetical protein L0206_13525 [Actinobacteria bacterium]|nr:hypothetical protein [Actinomycetota bacterium]